MEMKRTLTPQVLKAACVCAARSILILFFVFAFCGYDWGGAYEGDETTEGYGVGPDTAHFLYQVKILNRKAIAKLSDDALLSNYLDVLVEMRAASIFHSVAGFRPTEYIEYKQLLRYRADLEQEIAKRKLEIPDTFLD